MNVYVSIVDYVLGEVESSSLVQTNGDRYFVYRGIHYFIIRYPFHRSIVVNRLISDTKVLLYCKSKNILDQKIYKLRKELNRHK